MGADWTACDKTAFRSSVVCVLGADVGALGPATDFDIL